LSRLENLYISQNQLSGCYAPELTNLCSQLAEAEIYQGNNFYTTWEDFCDTGEGLCNFYSPCRQSDSLTLVALYNEINGLTWNLNTPIDTWQGVTLNAEGCVTQLIWVDGVISGSIPPEIGDLSHLKVLNLHENGIGGTIPPELENLTELEYLRATAFIQ